MLLNTYSLPILIELKYRLRIDLGLLLDETFVVESFSWSETTVSVPKQLSSSSN